MADGAVIIILTQDPDVQAPASTDGTLTEGNRVEIPFADCDSEFEIGLKTARAVHELRRR